MYLKSTVMKRSSIRKQLFILFVPCVLGLWIASAILSLWLVSTSSMAFFDRDLVNSADSIVGRLRVKDSRIVVDLPPAAQAILKHDDSDKFYYRVIGSNGEMISGDSELPAPSKDLKIDEPNVMTAHILGEVVRLVEIKVVANQDTGQWVIVQLAVTTNARTRFQESLLMGVAVPQLLVIILGLSAIWYGVAKMLTPLRSLQEQLAHRSQADLSPLSDNGTPEEVYPLVTGINQLFDRSREELKAHQRFIANAAHQLRTPLAGLKTYSSIGTEMCHVDELRRVVQDLDHGIDRASRMVTQLLALARTDIADSAIAASKYCLDLNTIVSEVVADLVGTAIRKNVELTYGSSPAPALVLGEQTGLRHLVANLVENAILYTETGGQVAVHITNEDGIQLTVSDTGRGIPIQEREKVFERFYRIVGTNGNGSGLGLSIVQEVANAHNASVRIDCGADGVGTIVVVRFPGSAFAER